MRPFRFFRSTIFRLAFFYAVFFSVAFIGLLSFVYFATVQEMEHQIRYRIGAQVNECQGIFTIRGVEALKKRIAEFIEEEDEGLSIYLLVDQKGRTLAGNMESWPEEVEPAPPSWLLFDIESRHVDTGVRVLAREVRFPDGYRLLVGYSLRAPDRMRHVIRNVVTVSVLLALLITALGSILFSKVIRRRLERVSHICAQVMHGDLDVRATLTGGDDAFDHLAANVNAMLERIALLVTGLRQTSDNIAHDLRTPLNRHRIKLENIIHHPADQKTMREAIKSGIEEIDAIVETLNSILRISQAQAGVASSHFVAFDLSSSLEDVLEFYAELAEEKEVTLLPQKPERMMVRGDKPLITQAIANLVDNAIKYTPSGGEISVTLAQAGRQALCTIADNGPGIPPAYHEKVRERFFRMEESRTSAGTGLGLSLVEAVAVLHRGHLEFADNQPGLVALLSLPIVLSPGAILPGAPPPGGAPPAA